MILQPQSYPNVQTSRTTVESMSTILLIEDDRDVLAAHWRFLRRTFPTSQVITAESASRAIAILATQEVEMVVSDYYLGAGGGTGGDVIRWMRANQPQLEDRFVFLTGSATEVSNLSARVMLKGTPPELMRAYLTGVMAKATT